jgi:PAS domain-containing protein
MDGWKRFMPEVLSEIRSSMSVQQGNPPLAKGICMPADGRQSPRDFRSFPKNTIGAFQRCLASSRANCPCGVIRARGPFRMQNWRDLVPAPEAQDFISAVLDTAGALAVVLDRQGRIVRFNRACECTTGHSFEEVRGRLLWDLLLISEEVELIESGYGL